jgi:hypothetical protein
MNTRSTYEYIVLVCAERVCSWRESGLANTVTFTHVWSGWERLLHGDEPAYEFFCVQKYVIVIGLRFKCDALRRIRTSHMFS